MPGSLGSIPVPALPGSVTGSKWSLQYFIHKVRRPTSQNLPCRSAVGMKWSVCAKCLDKGSVQNLGAVPITYNHALSHISINSITFPRESFLKWCLLSNLKSTWVLNILRRRSGLYNIIPSCFQNYIYHAKNTFPLGHEYLSDFMERRTKEGGWVERYTFLWSVFLKALLSTFLRVEEWPF